MVRQGVLGVAAVLALTPFCAWAQVGVDSGSVSADVTATTAYTDNFYFDTAGQPQADATGVVVTPRASYKATKGKLDLLARIEGELATFDLPGSADDMRGLIAAADEALYRAKRAGKNRTVRADGLPRL